VAGLNWEWPIVVGNPRYISVFLNEEEVVEEDGELVSYFAVLNGELSLVERGHGSALSIPVKYIPDPDDEPTSYMVEIDLDSVGARSLEPNLTLYRLDPLTGVVIPSESFSRASSRELPWIVSSTLGMTDTQLGSIAWNLMRPNRFMRPEWVRDFSQQDVRLPESADWLTRIFDRLRLPPGLRGQRIHGRFFESISGEPSCAFALHVENLGWWRAIRSLRKRVLGGRAPFETHAVTSWHLARDILMERVPALGQRALALRVAPGERIQGCEWDGVATNVIWDGRRDVA